MTRRQALILVCFGLTCLYSFTVTADIKSLGVWIPTSPPVKGDVVLGFGGELVGRVCDTSAKPLAGVIVTVQDGRRTLTKVVTRADGFFIVPGLPGGTYGLTIGRLRLCYRCWTPETAPPLSITHVELIARDLDVGTYNMPWAKGSFVLYR